LATVILAGNSLLILQSLLGALFGAATGALLHAIRTKRSPGRLVPVWLATLLVLVVPFFVSEAPVPASGQRLRIISVLDAETTSALVEAFTGETGISCDVDPFAGGTQTTAQLILQGRIQPDVLLGGTVEIHEELARADLLTAYEPAPDAYRIDRYDDPQRLWTPLYLGFIGLVYRPLPTLQTHPPDWNTLLQTRWKGRVTIPSPAESGGGLVFLATQILRQQDPDLAWEYLQQTVDRGVRFEARSDIPITLVASGTMDIGVAWAHDVLRRVERDRLPVELRIPERTGYEVGGVSILGWARDLDAAEAFVRFLTGKRAGQIQVAKGYRVPLRTDVEPPGYLDGGAVPEEITSFYDRGAVLENRAAWVDRWQALQVSMP
jgi:iron(III) transport system substrate-binding protein